jgi:hypothetical protein
MVRIYGLMILGTVCLVHDNRINLHRKSYNVDTIIIGIPFGIIFSSLDLAVGFPVISVDKADMKWMPG